ncbi:MAG: YbgC/FadM family acyl-CoA thioesterase [Sphaerochaeta sp.]|jgi:acyl-CoA thioester hydrolase|uniref:YbgC/FadM family acyl-CoA thioesterase n=1 Tax=Sphaerochaeta sp. TaxID=1972642 RepID=UPI003D12529D
MHSFKIRVYYSDTDCGGIVYHARYLDFAEHARTELLREVAQRQGIDGSQISMIELGKMAFVVKSITVDYQRPGRLDDLLEVCTEIESEKRFSITFIQTVKRGDEVLCVLKVRVASINTETLRPTPLPTWFTQAVQAL